MKSYTRGCYAFIFLKNNRLRACPYPRGRIRRLTKPYLFLLNLNELLDY